MGTDKIKAAEAIRRLHECLKRKPGQKPFAEQMAEYTCEEKELEEARLRRCGIIR